MKPSFIISGTDTDIGKTVVAALLTQALRATYWKPIQSGVADGTDTRTVQTLTGMDDSHFLPEAYVLTEPLSPHLSAERDGVTIDMERLALPAVDGHLIIEGAGGLLVPVTRHLLQVELFARWQLPIILCARTGLGTINHTLLSIEALRSRNLTLHGLIFVGADNPDNIRTIADISGARVLGHLPHLPVANAATLSEAFRDHFDLKDFL